MSAIAQTFEETSVLDLDALRRMSYTELSELYRSAKRPDFGRPRPVLFFAVSVTQMNAD